MLRRPSVVVRCPSSIRPPFSKIFFSKAAVPIEAKFHVESPWVRETKVYSGHLGHMTKMAATPIYGENPSKNLLLRNQRASYLGPWYVAFGHWAHQSLFKWWPWVDLDLFYGKVKFGPFCFYMGKSVRKSFNGKKLTANDQSDMRYMFT